MLTGTRQPLTQSLNYCLAYDNRIKLGFFGWIFAGF